MATSNIVPTEEKADCLRLLSLVIDGGSEVLFHQFDNRIPRADLSNKLNEPDIRKKLEKFLNKDQKNRVYRQISQPDSSRFDVTLLTTLLRYACGLDENSSVWNSRPSTTDVSVEADIARLKTIRNKMSHMNNLTLSKTEFGTYWDKAEEVILRLGHDIPDLKERINKLKHENIDPKERKYKEKLKEYKETEQSLKQDVEEVKDSLANVDKRLEIVESGVQSYSQLSAEVETQGERVENLQIEQEKHRDKLAELDKQTRNQAEHLEEISCKQSNLEHSLEQSTQFCESNITTIYNRLQHTDSVVAKVDEIRETVSKHVRRESGEVARLISRTRLHVDDDERHKVFVSTSAHRKAKNILENSGWVILTGQPGEGKTTIALELLRQMQPTRACVKLNDPEDWKIIDLERDEVDVIFVDDIFGGGAFNGGLFAEWSKLLPDISKAIQKKKINAVITTRHYILEEARERMHRQHVFRDENTVYIASYDLTQEEKIQMLEVHFRYAERELSPGLVTDCVYQYDSSFRGLPTFYNLRNHVSNHGDLSEYMRNGKIREFKSMIGFPEIVSLFAKTDHLFNVGSMFFFEPLIFFKKCMEDLYLDKEKFLALILVWTRPNQELKLLDIEPPDVSNKLKETAEKFGFKLEGTILTILRNSLEYHKGGFLLFDSKKGIYKFCHNIVKDMVGLVGGKKHPAAVLEYASLEFLMRYVSVDERKTQDGLHIFIEQFRYEQLINIVWNILKATEQEDLPRYRLQDMFYFFGVSFFLSGSSLNNVSILNHDCFDNESFVCEFIQHDNENVLLSHSVGTFRNIFGNYGISLQENIPVFLPSLAILNEKPALLCLCLERDNKQEIKDEHFLHTNTLLAIHKQSFRALESLFRHGAVANEDAIYLAARKGNATILKFLLERKHTSIQSKSNVPNGNSPLIAAAKTTSTECVIALLNDGRDVNYKNEKGWTALDKGILYGRLEVCKLLLEHGALVNNKSGKFKRTPLHRSAEFGDIELTKVLLENKASVDVRDSKGLLPIHCAAFSGEHDIVDMLLKAQPGSKQLNYRISYGKKSVLSGADLFHIAVWKNKPEVIKVLMLNEVNPNVRDFYGRTPLYRAAYEGKMDSIKEFISYFDQNNADNKTVPALDINIAENHGFTPLHAAIHMGHTEIAKLICPYANVNAQDKLGKTPLHTACEKLNLEMFELLIKVHHADFRTVTKPGQSIFDILENKCKNRNFFKILGSSDKLLQFIIKEPRWVDFLTTVKEVDEEFAKNCENITGNCEA